MVDRLSLLIARFLRDGLSRPMIDRRVRGFTGGLCRVAINRPIKLGKKV